MLQDYPHSPTTTFLTPQEKTYLQERLKLDSDGLSLEFKRKFIWHAFLDYKVWIFAFMYQVESLPVAVVCPLLTDFTVLQGCLMPVYSFSLFSPTLTANLGYSAANAQLLSVVSSTRRHFSQATADCSLFQPPYVLAALTTISAGFISDRLQRRAGLVILFSGIGALGMSEVLRASFSGLPTFVSGFLLLIVTDIPGINFWGLFMAAAGCYVSHTQ